MKYTSINGTTIELNVQDKVVTENNIRTISSLLGDEIHFTDGSRIQMKSLFMPTPYVVVSIKEGVIHYPLGESRYCDIIRATANKLLIESLALKPVASTTSKKTSTFIGEFFNADHLSYAPDTKQEYTNNPTISTLKGREEMPDNMYNMFSQVKQAVPLPLTEKKFDVMGVNIYKASADSLIVLIHSIQDRIDKLETVPVASSYVDAKVAELNKAMKKVVKELDSRAS